MRKMLHTPDGPNQPLIMGPNQPAVERMPITNHNSEIRYTRITKAYATRFSWA